MLVEGRGRRDWAVGWMEWWAFGGGRRPWLWFSSGAGAEEAACYAMSWRNMNIESGCGNLEKVLNSDAGACPRLDMGPPVCGIGWLTGQALVL